MASCLNAQPQHGPMSDLADVEGAASNDRSNSMLARPHTTSRRPVGTILGGLGLLMGVTALAVAIFAAVTAQNNAEVSG